MDKKPDVQITWHDRLPPFLWKPSFHLLLLVLTGFALYLRTLPYPFVLDDRVFIMGNPLIMNSAGFLDLLDINDFLPEYLPRLNDSDMVTSFALRPVAYMTFRLNYLLGGDNPAGYRFLNIVIHICNAALLYRLLQCIIRLRVEADSVRRYAALPFFAAFLFLVHPLQTESVTYVIQRFTSLGTFYYLATILLYLQSLLCASSFTRRLAFAGSVAALFLGMLAKEFVFTAPLSLVLIEYIVLRKTLRQSLVRHIPHLVCLLVIPAILMTLSYDMTGKSLSVGSATTLSNLNGYSRFEYATTQVRVILSYFRLLVLPYNQNFDPEYTLFKSPANPEIVLAVMVWALFLGAAIVLLRKKERSLADDLVAFSIIWFPLLLGVSSSVVPLPDLMSEHRTYLPSLAFCIGMTAHLYSRSGRWSMHVFAGGCVVLVLFGILTVMRNQTYSSRLSLWSDTAAKSPGKARPALALGNIYQEMNQYETAIAWHSRAIQLGPDYIEPYISLGALYQGLGRDIEAIGLYESYLETHAPERRMLSNLALAYANVGMSEEALSTLKVALTIDPDDEMLHLIIAEHLFLLGRNDEADSYIAKARVLDRGNPLVNVSGLIKMLEQQHKNRPEANAPRRGKVAS